MSVLSHELDAARRTYWEDAGRSLAVAVDVHERARTAGDGPMRARALALQGACSLHRGDLHGALALAAEGDLLAGGCLFARVELAALKSHLNFFSGSYAAAPTSGTSRGVRCPRASGCAGTGRSRCRCAARTRPA